jgi:hypothetical protein
MFAAMLRITNQSLTDGIDDEIQALEWDLPNQHRAVVRQLRDSHGLQPSVALILRKDQRAIGADTNISVVL